MLVSAVSYAALIAASGKRFALWLSRHEPRLFADLVGKELFRRRDPLSQLAKAIGKARLILPLGR